MNVIQIMNEDCESGEKEVLGVGISVYSQRMRIAWLQEGSKEALRFLPSARSERRTVTLCGDCCQRYYRLVALNF